MKRKTVHLLAFLATAVCGLRAQSADSGDPPERGEMIRYQLILPEEKAPEVVKPSEPNPFSKADNHVIKEDGASGEENRVREILSSLPITGFVDGGLDGPRVLIGPMKLKRGDIVPKVLAEQSVQLRVNSISRQQIDLIWVEKKKSTGLAPRVVTLPVHVKPKVRIALPSMPAAPEPGKSNGNYIFQNDPSMQGGGSDTPPETRKAVAVEEPSPAAQASASTAKADAGADHPANLIMNYLFKAANKTIEAPPAPK